MVTSLAPSVPPDVGALGLSAEAGLASAARAETGSLHVLVVDDEPRMQRTIVEYLEKDGFAVSGAIDAEAAAKVLGERKVDLVVLDIHLGLDSGFDLLRDLRHSGGIPVVVVSGRHLGESDRVAGLELGADDYLLKPFSLRELLARIRAVLRRVDVARTRPPSMRTAGQTRFQGWTFDRQTRRLLDPEGNTVGLSRGEFALLSVFADSPGRPLSREALVQATHLYGSIFDRSIDVQIMRLRRKLERDPRNPSVIRTERGFGYTFTVSLDDPS